MSAAVTTCAGDDHPLSFLHVSPSASADQDQQSSSKGDVTCFERTDTINNDRRRNSASLQQSGDGDGDDGTTSKDESNSHHQQTETPQQRAARLLAMCDERGVGRRNCDEKIIANANHAAARTSSSSGAPSLADGRGLGTNSVEAAPAQAGIDRSARTSKMLAGLVSGLGEDMRNNENNEGCGEAGTSELFNDSMMSLRTEPGHNEQGNGKDNMIADRPQDQSQQPTGGRSLDESFASSRLPAADNLDVDDVLRHNDRLEYELYRLRTLLTKRTQALEGENSKLSTQVSQARDAHRTDMQRVVDQSQSVISDLMERAEHLQRGMTDLREVNDGLMDENNRLREDNHYLRAKVDELEIELEGAGGGGRGVMGGGRALPHHGSLQSGGGNVGRILAGWGLGRRAGESSSAPPPPPPPPPPTAVADKTADKLPSAPSGAYHRRARVSRADQELLQAMDSTSSQE